MGFLSDLAKQARQKLLEGGAAVQGVLENGGQRAGQALDVFANHPDQLSYGKALASGQLTNSLPQPVQNVIQPVNSTIGNFINNRLPNPVQGASNIVQGISTPGLSAVDRAGKIGFGALNVASTNPNFYNFSASPKTQAAYTLGFPALQGLTSGIEAVRHGQNPIAPAVQGFTGEKYSGLGNAITDNPTARNILNGTGELASYIGPSAYQGIQGIKNIKGLNLKSAQLAMHPEDVKYLDSAIDTLYRPGVTGEPLQQASQTLKTLADHYLPPETVASANGDSVALAKALQQRAQYKPNITGNFGMNLVDNNGSTPTSSSAFENPQDPYFNVNKLNIDDEGKNFAKSEIEGLKPEVEKVTGQTMSNQSVLDLANETSDIKRKVIGEAQTQAEIANNLKIRQELAAMSQSGQASREFIDTFIQAKAYATDAGRTLQALSINADPKLRTPLNAILEAVYKVNQNADELEKAAQGVDFNDARQAAEFYRQFVKPKLGEYSDLIRYNSMLSSPNTHFNNAFGNAVNAGVVAPIEKTVTGALDFLNPVRRFQGKDQTQFAQEGPAYVKGFAQSLPDAAGKFVDALSGKNASGNLDVRDIPLYTKGIKGKVVEPALRLPMRLLEASDQFFTALTEGGERNALKLRQSKGVNIADSAIEKQSQDNAAYRLFRGELGDERQGNVLDAVDKVTGLINQARNSNNKILSTIASYTLPFVKTPMNILKQGIEYSPAGFATIPGAPNKTEQLSKALIGTSGALATAMLVASGRTTWAEPTSDKQKQAFRAAGMQPYSIKIGDNWVSYAKLPPALSFPIAFVSSVHDAVENKLVTQSDADSILSAVAKYGNFFADQSYLKNIGDLLAAVKGDPERMASFASNYPQQLLPFRALSGWIARLTDPQQRQVDKDAGFWDKQVQQLFTQIPGLSQTVPARLDQNGNPIENQNRVINAFSPVRVTNEDSAAAQDFHDIKSDSMYNKNENAIDKFVANGGNPDTLQNESFLQKVFGIKDVDAASEPQQDAAIDSIVDGSDVSPVEKASLKKQLKDLNKKEQRILNNRNISTAQKNQQATQIENQVKDIKDKLKTKKEKVDYSTVSVTGLDDLDKSITAKQKGQLTSDINSVVKDYVNGKISKDDAESQIEDLKAQRLKLTTPKAKKGRKIKIATSKRIAVKQAEPVKQRSISIKSPASNFKISTTRIKLSQPKRKIKVTKPNIKKISLKK